MKKLFIAIAGVFILFSCKTSENKNENTSYVIKMNMKPGDKFSHDFELLTDMNMTLMGTPRNMKMKVNTSSDLEVVDSTEKGNRIKVIYNTMDTRVSSEGSDFFSDTSYNKTINKVLGKPVTIIYQNNKVTDVEQPQIVQEFSDSTGTGNTGQLFTAQHFNNMYGVLFNLYPAKAVGKDSSWVAINSIDLSGMAMPVKTTYTLLNVKDNVAEIGISGVVDSQDGILKQGDININASLKGNLSGKIYIDITDGYLKNGEYNLTVNGTMNMVGQNMPVQMNSTYKINEK